MPAGLSLVLGVVVARQRPLWRDEMATWEFSRLPLADLAKAARHVDGSFAPYYALMHEWQLLFPTAWALRVPSLLAGAATVAVLAALAGQLWNRWSGCLAGVALATNGAFVEAMATARPAPLAALGCAIATWHLLRVRGAAPVRRTWVWYGVTMVAAVALQLFAVLVLLAHAVVVATRCCAEGSIRGARGGRLINFVLAATPALATAVLLVVLSSGERGQISWILAPTVEGVRDALLAALGISQPWWGLLVVAAAAVIGWGCVRKRVSVDSAVLAVALLVVPAAALLAISVLVQPAFVPRYLLVAPLGAGLLLAGAVQAVRTDWVPAAAVLAALLIVSVQATVLRAQFSAATPDEYPSLTRRIATLVQPGDTLVLGQNFNAEGAAIGVAYYLPDDRLVRVALHRLPTGSQELLVAQVLSTAPWRTAERARPRGRTLLVGLIIFGRNSGHPDGYANLIALGCRPIAAAPRQDFANYGLEPMRCP